jgi:hypothetical protein
MPWAFAWYFVPISAEFRGVDAVFYDRNTLYILQMTVAKDHKSVGLMRDLGGSLTAWQSVPIFFVTLVDTRDRQRFYLARTKPMIKDS